jgi:hypothetical protein
MRLALAMDDFGRMVCTAQHDGSEAVITASDVGCAVAALSKAVEELAESGVSECYWPAETGDYRWVFRRVGDVVRIANTLESIGTLTGWEHVFWAECESDDFLQQAREQLSTFRFDFKFLDGSHPARYH